MDCRLSVSVQHAKAKSHDDPRIAEGRTGNTDLSVLLGEAAESREQAPKVVVPETSARDELDYRRIDVEEAARACFEKSLKHFIF